MANSAILDIFRIRDLRSRILFTLIILIVFRFGATVPIPGIDAGALKSYFTSASGTNNILDYIDFFAGGGFKNFSLFMLGIMPYISTSIMLQLLVAVFPKLKAISEEEGGRKKIQRYTRFGTVFVAMIQSFAMSQWALTIPDAVKMNGVVYTVLAMMTLSTGTIFLMWMGEQITQRGIGNGISLIIFAGIVARVPNAIYLLYDQIRLHELNPIFLLVVVVLFVVVVALVIYEQQGQRKIPVHYAKRVVGRKMVGAQSTYIPLKINPASVIPVIFASSIIQLLTTMGQGLGARISFLRGLATGLQQGSLGYYIIYPLLIVFFAYFYTQVILNPIEMAKQIREHGGSIPGIRTEKMESYLAGILSKIVLPGGLFLAFIAIIPTIINGMFNIPRQVSYLLGGTSLIIMVGVVLDTISQIEGHLRMHHHEGLSTKGKIRSRKL